MFDLKIGSELPKHECYDEQFTKRAFWRVSYKCGVEYVNANDATGQPFIIQHEAEELNSYKSRKRRTKPRNHAGSIVRKYSDYVFRNQINRVASDTLAQLLEKDADSRGNDLDGFMKDATLQAQIDGVCYLMPDTTGPSDGRVITVAQARALNVRPLIRKVNADSVVNWTDVEGYMIEAIVTFQDATGKYFARYYNDTEYFDIGLKFEGKRIVILTIDAPKPHGYSRIPLISVKPCFDSESQISSLAESQQQVSNLLSLLNEELYNHTFTRWIATGITIPADVQDKQRTPSMVFSGKRILMLESPSAKIERLGSDVTQAESIRESIREEELNLYRTAGIKSPDPLKSGPAESGIAKMFNIDDLSVNLTAIADAAEDAENKIMELIYTAEGMPVPEPARYPDDFNVPDFLDELTELQQLLSTPIPKVIKDKGVKQFVGSNYDLTEAEQAEFETELEADDYAPEVPTSPNPLTTPAAIPTDATKPDNKLQ